MMVPSRWTIEIAVPWFSDSDATKILEVRWFDAAAGKTDDLAVAADHLAREDRGPDSRDPAHDRLDDHVGRRLSRHEFLEIAPVGDAHIRHRPHLGRVDQPAIGVEQIEPADMRQRRELGTQHFMRTQCRHLLFEFVRCLDPVCPHIGDDVIVHMLEIAELLVEMARQQQRRVVEFALGNLECPLAKLQREIAGAEHDRDYEAGGAQDKPLDRADPHAGQRPGDRPPQPPRDHAVRCTIRHFPCPRRRLL
jgi:hypothetical protein